MTQELIEKYRVLLEDNANLANDYMSERDIRRNYQKTVDEQKKVLLEVERHVVSVHSSH